MTKVNVPPENALATFARERSERISRYSSDVSWRDLSNLWLKRAFEQKYMYNFTWANVPVIQTPIDMVAMQELIWKVCPDLIIETGIAHGGSLVFSATMLALLDLAEALQSGMPMDPKKSNRKVLGIDVDIREHNRREIERNPFAPYISMIQGDSIAAMTVDQVHKFASGFSRVLVCLDSNHTHSHVLAELEAYAPLVTRESYCVVFDTIVEDMPPGMFPDRPWAPGDNPKTAVHSFLSKNANFEIDRSIEAKLMVTVAPDGFLRRKS